LSEKTDFLKQAPNVFTSSQPDLKNNGKIGITGNVYWFKRLQEKITDGINTSNLFTSSQKRFLWYLV